MPIITSDDLVAHLGLGGGENPDRLDLIADGLNAWASSRTARDWAQVTRTNEQYRGRGTAYLVLKHYPIVSLSALTVDDEVLDVTDPDVVDIWNEQRGIIVRTDGQLFTDSKKRNVTVTYLGGPRSVPADLKLAVIELAAWVFQTTGGRLSVGSSGESVAFMNLLNTGVDKLPMVDAALRQHADVLG